jgi:MurNAc alpha-1-phosphate uridylyltransferase
VAALASVVLAAGAGTRLRPLTWLRPKALCPVDNVPLVDLAVDRMRRVAGAEAVAVNVHHDREAMEAHLAGRVHLSVEEREALGTAGALGNLRGWIDGRPTVVVNVDAWSEADVAELVAGWDGERVRLLIAGDDFGPQARVVGCLMPWTDVATLEPRPSGLYEECWRPAWEAGRLDVVRYAGPFVDCGTPAGYLAANLAASGGVSVVGAGAEVEGVLEGSVVWPGVRVHRHEVLRDAVRAAEHVTVLVRGRR